MKALIMRGITGAGKTSHVGSLPGTKVICSADIAHVQGGVYKFNPALKEKAHNDCLILWISTLRRWKEHGEQWDWLICDNTNTTSWEIAPYYRLAEIYGIQVEILRIEVDPVLACKRNTHQVPIERVFNMWWTLRSTKLPSHWKERVIIAPGVHREVNYR